MKRTIIAALLALMLSPAAAQQRQAAAEPVYNMTLEQCLAYAMGNSYTRQQMLLSQESYDVSYDQARLERVPNLTASASENYSHARNQANDYRSSWSGSYGLNTSVTLFQGGNVNNTIKQTKLQAEQAGVQTAKYDNELTIQVLQSFLSILGNEELLRYQQSLVKQSEEQYKQAADQLALKTILPSDYLMFEAQVAGDRNNVVDTETGIENGLLTLKGLLSMDMDATLGVIAPDTGSMDRMTVIPSQDYFTESAAEAMPDYELLKYGVEIAESNVKLARSSFYPTLNLSGGLSSGYTSGAGSYHTQVGDRFSQSAGLSLSVPIFNKGRTKANVARSRISLQQAELDRLQSELDLRQTLIQEYRNAEAALNRYRAAEVKETAYRKSFEAYTAQFNAGAITPVELLQQQNNYVSALYDYVQSKYNFMLRRKILDVYMGMAVEM